MTNEDFHKASKQTVEKKKWGDDSPLNNEKWSVSLSPESRQKLMGSNLAS